MVSTALIGGIMVAVVVVIGAYLLLMSKGATIPSSTTTTISSYSTVQSTTSGFSTSSTTTIPTTTVNSNQAGVVTFAVAENDYSIAPNTFVINLNQTAYFSVTNYGTQDHDFGIYSLGPSFGTPVLNGGEGKGVFEFNSSSPGNYIVYSNVGNDRNMGMVGTLTIR
jgi:hypothetical protein